MSHMIFPHTDDLIVELQKLGYTINDPWDIVTHFENKLAAILYVKTTVIAPKKQLSAAGGNLPVHPVIKYNVPTR